MCSTLEREIRKVTALAHQSDVPVFARRSASCSRNSAGTLASPPLEATYARSDSPCPRPRRPGLTHHLYRQTAVNASPAPTCPPPDPRLSTGTTQRSIARDGRTRAPSYSHQSQVGWERHARRRPARTSGTAPALRFVRFTAWAAASDRATIDRSSKAGRRFRSQITGAASASARASVPEPRGVRCAGFRSTRLL